MTTVVHIITALGSGGAERMLYLVASRKAGGDGVRHVVVSLAGPGFYGARLREAGIELHCLRMRRGRLSPRAFYELVGLLRRLRPDVLMTWLYHADLLGTLAGRLAGVRRIIWNVRCSDMDFTRYAPLTRGTVAVLARLSRMPWAIATNSRAGQRVHDGLGYRPKRWVYLPNGFDTNEWKPDAQQREAVRSELGLSEGDILAGMVARVDPQKDHATFLEAVRMLSTRYRRLRVLLVGHGTVELSLPEELRSSTVALGERRDVPRVLRALDLLVSSSAYGEGFPNIIGEAMASGVPCVATNVGDTASIVAETGLVVPPRDARALASAIEAMIGGRVDRSALATSARTRIEAQYSLENCLQRYADLIRKAAAREDKAPRPGVPA
jgi:glycosyltransferase involved in cell wall biosynthesis